MNNRQRQRRNPNSDSDGRFGLENSIDGNNNVTNNQPQVPSFHRNSRGQNSNSNSIDEMRLNENYSQSSNISNGDNLALLINLDEIIGNFSSLRTTPNPSRMETPALSEVDPGTEIEVRYEDLRTCDIQGVNWNTFSVSRENYRDIRVKEYREFESIHHNTLDILPEENDRNRIKINSPVGPMLSFRYMNKVDSCNVPHFQLRHLICCPTVRSVIFPHFMRIKSWNPISNQSEIILNTSEFGSAFSKTSVIAATESQLYVGGFSGEIIIKNLNNDEAPAILKNYSTDPNCITNHISTIEKESKIIISCNDATLRILDLITGKIKTLARFPYAVNASEASIESNLVACVGDSRKVRILDIKSCVEVTSLQGHLDHCFSVSWSPCGRYLASGSQDRSSRIFDIRKTNQSLHTLVGNMAPIRCVKFSPCGSLFTMMEADDFVHIFDVHSNFKESQVIDFFGEISGITFDPEGNNFYIGCAGNENGGIFEFNNPFLSL